MELIRRHFDVIDSTNTWAKNNAHLLPQDKITLITAHEQTAGRGRFKRKWVSAPGQNLLASFCFFIENHRADNGNLPQVLAISAAKSLEELGFKPTLKWPNDILLSKKKVAGILAETTSFSGELCFILGIGLNVNMPANQLQEIDRPATSLSAEGKRPHDIEEVLMALKRHFVADLDLFLNKGFGPFLDAYRGRLDALPGDPMRFDDNRKIWEGSFHSISDDGSLNLVLSSGENKNFIAGEILWPGNEDDFHHV